MLIDIIIPAMNEAKTIGAVVNAARRSKSARRVIVIDDGSKDNTARIAVTHGAEALRLARNGGKGRAMRLGLEYSDSPHVAFLDADLRGFQPAHLDGLVSALVHDRLDMVCGLRDYGRLQNAFQHTRWAETITGERICARWMLELIPLEFWSGYAIEAAINGYARALGCKVGRQLMPGVSIVNKTEKQGLWNGLKSHAKMFKQVGETIERVRHL